MQVPNNLYIKVILSKSICNFYVTFNFSTHIIPKLYEIFLQLLNLADVLLIFL